MENVNARKDFLHTAASFLCSVWSNKHFIRNKKRLEVFFFFLDSAFIIMLSLRSYWEGRDLQQQCRKAHIVPLKKPGHKEHTLTASNSSEEH